MIQIALDEAIPGRDQRLLATLAILYLAAVAVDFLLQYAQSLLTTWLGQKVMYDLRGELFRKFQRLDAAFHDRNPVGRLMTRITNDVETLNQLFSSGVVAIFGDLFTLLFIVAMMLRMNWELALVTLTVMPLVMGAALFFRRRMRSAFRDVRLRVARMNAFLHERLTGMSVVQLFNREETDAGRHADLNRKYLEAHLRSITYYALFFPVIELFASVALALILWRGGSSILQGALTVGVAAAFLQYARRFFRPIQDLSEKYNLVQSAMASSERIFKLLDREPAVREPDDPLSLRAPFRGEVEFRDVSFAYGDDEDGRPDWVLRGVSFRIAAGERVAIVGHTGAGKTTLVNLLMRFHDPQKGEILLDGIPVRRLALGELRSHIGLVLQDVFLFSQSVEYNVRLGSARIGEDRVREAAERVGAASFIDRLPGGYAQELGERGSTLSVGERQLVSFARALAYDPGILVLDEATSSVDSEVEARIEAATRELLRGRTSVVIAHRLATVRCADKILVLHHGVLAEEGTHDALLRRGGLYAKLHELQFAVGAGQA